MADTTPVSDKTFETLNERQQALVDELARERIDGLDRKVAQIVEDAADGQDFDAYDPSYVSHLRRTHADIIDERADALLNSHATVERGNVSVTGEVDLTDLPKEQGIKERPVKGEMVDDDQPLEDDDPRVRVDISLESAFDILSKSAVPEDYRREVFEAVVEL